jgi:hypothetical protein
MGLFAVENVEGHTYMFKYLGNMVDSDTYDKLVKRYGDKQFFLKSNGRFIDGNNDNNIARFINHQCEGANCQVQEWTVNGRVHVAIYTLRDIVEGEELTMNYMFGICTVDYTCLCSSPKCTGFMNTRVISYNNAYTFRFHPSLADGNCFLEALRNHPNFPLKKNDKAYSTDEIRKEICQMSNKLDRVSNLKLFYAFKTTEAGEVTELTDDEIMQEHFSYMKKVEKNTTWCNNYCMILVSLCFKIPVLSFTVAPTAEQSNIHTSTVLGDCFSSTYYLSKGAFEQKSELTTFNYDKAVVMLFHELNNLSGSNKNHFSALTEMKSNYKQLESDVHKILTQNKT